VVLYGIEQWARGSLPTRLKSRPQTE